MKIHSAAARDRCVDMLVHLDVNNAEASFAADKALLTKEFRPYCTCCLMAKSSSTW